MTDETDGTQHTRRQLIAGVGTGLATLPLVSFSTEAVSDGTLTELATTYHALANTDVGRERAVGRGLADGASWMVTYTEGSRDSLGEWLDAQGNRRLLAEHRPSRSATVTGRPGDIGTEVTKLRSGRGLQGKDWVELIDLDIEIKLAEPLASLESGLEASGLGLGWRERTLLDLQAGVPGTDGLAFDEDADPIGPAGLRRLLRADTVSVADDGETPADDSETVTTVDTSGLTVAVVDTGFNTANGVILGDSEGDATPSRLSPASKSLLTGQTVAADGAGAVEDGHGHGSFLASLILGEATPADRGLLPEAELLAIRAIDDEGTAATSQIATGIRYAADQGADVVCLGVSSAVYSAGIDRALAYAADQGTVTVAPVGNDRQGSRWIASPAASASAIGVAAVSGDRPDEARSAYFSSLGPHPGTGDLSGGQTAGAAPTVAAPGMKLRTVVGRPDGSTTERVLSGTSVAAATVAGVVGLLLAADGSLGGEFEAVRDRLQDHARPIPNAAAAEVGAGMADARAAITETETADQSAAMTDSAGQRHDSYTALSRQQTGLLSLLA